MNLIIESFISLPFFWRVTILLFFIIFVIWRIFGKWILWILSIIPFALQGFFRAIYWLLEIPVAALHKKLGICFYKIDNLLSQFGKKIDSVLLRWNKAWRLPKKICLWKSLFVYVVCVVVITLPSLIKVETDIYRKGECIYLQYESILINWFEKCGWYNKAETVSLNQDIQATQEISEELETSPITLVVSGLNSSLLVRDTPSTENFIELDRLYNGDTVTWSGLLIFSEMGNDSIEPWVKVITPNGIEGWTRLFYLYPEQYDNTEFYVQIHK